MNACIQKGKYKAIFSDIDGTLLNTSHKIPDQTKQKIRKLREQGVPFILVSARMPKGMEKIRDELDSKSPMICYSGALVVDEKKQPIYSAFLQSDLVRRILRIIKDGGWNISLNVYSNDHWYVEDLMDHWIVDEMKITGIAAEERLFRDEGLYEDVHKILCMGNADQIQILEKVLIGQFPNIRIYRSKDTYLEIMSMEASKSDAIQKLEGYFKICKDEIIAFGDSYNNIDMLSYAGLGVAMGNADDAVKKAADIIGRTNDEEGLRLVLEEAF